MMSAKKRKMRQSKGLNRPLSRFLSEARKLVVQYLCQPGRETRKANGPGIGTCLSLSLRKSRQPDVAGAEGNEVRTAVCGGSGKTIEIEL